MLLSVPAGSTSKIIQIPIYDSSSIIGALLAGLAYNTGSLTAYYNREGAAGAATAITLATATKGTWATGGFVAVDGTNMPGWYELHIPNAALAAGAKSVAIHLKGAANMVPAAILIELTAVSNQDAVRGGMTALPNANAEASGGLYTRGVGAGQINQYANGLIDVNVKDINGYGVNATTTVSFRAVVGSSTESVSQTGDSYPIVNSGTYGAAVTKTALDLVKTKTDFLPSATAGAAGGVFIAGTNAATTITTALTTTFTGNLTGTVATVTNLTNAPTAGDLTATMKTSVTTACSSATPSVTVSDKTGFSLTATPPTASQIRTEMDSNSTKLANLDAAISSRSTYAGADTAGTTTLLSRVPSALTITGGKVDVNDKTGFSLTATPPTAAQVRTEMDSNSTKLAHLDADISSRLAASGYTAPDNADITAIKAKTDNLPASPAAVGSAMTLAANQDVRNVSGTITDKTGYSLVTAPPTAVQVRTEMDSNSLKLALLDAEISSRLAASGYTAPDNSDIAAIKSKTDNLPASPAAVGSAMTLAADQDVRNVSGTITDKTGFSLATAPPTAQQIWEYVTRTLTSSGSGGATAQEVWEYATRALTDKAGFSLASAPPTAAQVRTEMDANSTKLAHLDADISSRLATSGYTGPDNTSITTILTAIQSATYGLARLDTEIDAITTAVGTLALNADIQTILTRLSATRAGYLDNLTMLDQTLTAAIAAIRAGITTDHGAGDYAGTGGDSDPDAVADAVLNALLADHTVSGSVARGIATASAGGVDLDLLSEAVSTQLADEHGAGAWGSQFAFISSNPRAYSVQALNGRAISIMRGDTPTIPFNLAEDYNGWSAWFGAKGNYADTVYVIGPVECVWDDIAHGLCHVPLTTIDTASTADLVAEVELRNGAQRLTPLQFALKIRGDVIQ